jgi:TM2 domain-containing membrane protein YozV
MTDSVRSQMMFEANRKSVGVAYLLWFFVGWLGAHRFYLGQTGTGVAQLLLTLIGAVLAVVIIGFFLLAIVGVWLLVDLFLIPGMVQNHNMQLIERLNP